MQEVRTVCDLVMYCTEEFAYKPNEAEAGGIVCILLRCVVESGARVIGSVVVFVRHLLRTCVIIYFFFISSLLKGSIVLCLTVVSAASLCPSCIIASFL